ncbi:hypothetical protein [Kaistella jeonii]|nr:hypothetical protein [Kaistella jeonii]SFC44772.1 hypothetical protein SAMN05421876_1272 [Kaistella jeonii]VEI96522.1 Uncharacterised protein [Kaistella jeonii]
MKLYRLLVFLNLTFLIIGCNGQENPNYIGKQYGTFKLEKITFKENLDSLFSKVNKDNLIFIVGKDSYFDTIKKKQIYTDTTDYVYRIPHAKMDSIYSFKNFKLKDVVVSFYTDKQKRFRRVDFSTYMTAKQYKDFIKNIQDYSDITTDKIKKSNNGKYIIFELKEGTKKTLIYSLENDANDEDGNYFIRVRINDLTIKNDTFDKMWNSENGI